MKKMTRFFLYFSLFFLVHFFPSYSEELEEEISTYINSKNIFFDNENNKVVLGKDSYINNDEVGILSDEGFVDFKNNEIEIKDKFYLLQNEEIFSGYNLKADTGLENVTAENVSYIINANFKIESNNLVKNQNIIKLYDNYVTPCKVDGFFNCPTWSLIVSETSYDQNTDQYKHYDTFLQIADIKLFYLPYFSHYGQKAPRKSGFLTPSFNILNLENNELNITTPYYIPLNDQADVTITPTINLLKTNKFSNLLTYGLISSSGDTSISISTSYDETKSEGKTLYNTIEMSDKSVIDKNSHLDTKLIFTNNLSQFNDNRDETNPFEEMYINYNKYNTFYENDFTKISLNAVTAFNVEDQSTTPNSIPELKYYNFVSPAFFGKNIYLKNQINISNIYRNTALYGLPNNRYNFMLKNNYKNRNYLYGFNLTNSFNNILNLDYVNYFDETYEQGNRLKNIQIFSSEVNKTYNFNPRNIFKTKVEGTFYSDFSRGNIILNEDTKSISLDYHNLFTENRLNGFDIGDDDFRIAYGIEYKNRNKDNPITEINIGQAYNFDNSSEYISNIKSDGRTTDYLSNIDLNFNQISSITQLRLDKNDLSVKEIFTEASLSFKDDSISLFFNQTDEDSFVGTEESQNIGFSAYKKINDNINMGYSSSFDVLSNYQPYAQSLTFNIFDDCSLLEITYENIRYNDLNNTKPKESIRFKYYMDYLGFFSYDQNFNNLFKNFGEVNYGQ
tara:strand:- start:42 stop:2234 length:2193 start_codon:yes stop_codon:yes gene_type:complete